MPVFPGGGGGGSNLPWLNTAVQYVSGTGNDSSTGRGWDTAKSTWYAAAVIIAAAGGGTIYLGPGWKAGGPVDGQGMWLNGTAMEIPGFVNAGHAKISTIGVGGAVDTNQFSLQQVMGYGGSNLAADYRTKPGIWMIGGQVSWTFQNIGLLPAAGHAGTYNEGLFVPIRQAIDYNRNVDGSIRYMTATSSARAAGQATHVVTLPAGVPTTTGGRDGSVVTLYIPQPAGASFPPWNAHASVWIESTDVNFPSGAYTVTLPQATVDDQTQWGFSYVDAGMGSVALAGTITVSSPACQEGSFVEVQTTNFRVPCTQYQVVSATPSSASTATIVLTDIWGGFTGIGTGTVPVTLTSGDYGVQIATLEMGYAVNVRTELNNASSPTMSQAEASIDTYLSGPGVHIGGARAFFPEINNNFMVGYYPHGAGKPPYDKYRMAACVVNGTNAAGGGGVRLNHITGTQVSIVGTFGEEPSTVEIGGENTWDTSTGYPPPPLDCVGGPYSVINITGKLQVADAVTGGIPVLTGYYPLNLRGNYDWGGVMSAAGSVTAQGDVSGWRQQSTPLVSPWAAPTGPAYGVWGGGLGGASGTKLAGPHPAAWRQISPTMARFANLIPPPASWNTPPSTGTADPMGGTGAVTFDDTVHGSATGSKLATRTDTFFAAGGHFVMCGWINVQNGATNPQGLFEFGCDGDLVWEPISATGRQSDFLYTQEFGGPGWMFWYYAPKLISGSASQTYSIYVLSTTAGSGKTMSYFGLGAYWCPPTLSDNDVMEFIGTMRAQPYYLRPGEAGTFEGQPFYADGGLGATLLTKTAGAATGKVIPVLDSATGAVVGYINVVSAV